MMASTCVALAQCVTALPLIMTFSVDTKFRIPAFWRDHGLFGLDTEVTSAPFLRGAIIFSDFHGHSHSHAFTHALVVPVSVSVSRTFVNNKIPKYYFYLLFPVSYLHHFPPNSSALEIIDSFLAPLV